MSKIAVLLTQGFADWEYALIAGTGGPFYGFEVQFFCPDAGEICSQGGIRTSVSQELQQLSAWQSNAIVIIGGTVWETADAPDISELLLAHHADGGVVAGICGGTLALARAGLLEQKQHTSNAASYLTQHAKNYSGAVHYLESASAVIDDRVITAPGTAPVSFTASIFASVGLDQSTVAQFKSMLAAEHLKS